MAPEALGPGPGHLRFLGLLSATLPVGVGLLLWGVFLNQDPIGERRVFGAVLPALGIHLGGVAWATLQAWYLGGHPFGALFWLHWPALL